MFDGLLAVLSFGRLTPWFGVNYSEKILRRDLARVREARERLHAKGGTL